MSLNHLIRLLRITVIVIILFSLILGTPLDSPITDQTSAGDISNYTKESFRGEYRENTTSIMDHELRLAEYTSYFEDDFVDESNIVTKNNIDINIFKDEVRLAASKNTFIRTFPGTSNDYGFDCKQTHDGGYILTGMVQSYGKGGTNLWLIKTDSYGTELWNRTFGSEWDDFGYFVEVSADSGYIVGGYVTNSTTQSRDGFLVKTDTDGNEEWNRTYGGNKTDQLFDIAPTTDGGYILTGHKINYGTDYADVWLLKVNDTGFEQWNRTIGGIQSDYGKSVAQTTDGGYVITGMTFSYGMGDSDLWVVKVNATGNETWNFTYGDDNRDVGISIRQTSDGGYIIVGDTDTMGANRDDALLIKLDSTGKQVWDRSYGEWGDDFLTSVLQTSDNGYLMAGHTESFDAVDFDGWLVKTDEIGLEQWSRLFGGHSDDIIFSLQPTDDGGYITVGSSDSYSINRDNFWLVKTNGSGYCDVRGNFTSKINTLNKFSSLKSFFCYADMPKFTDITVQFSQDNITWYNSYYTKDAGDILVNGNNTIGTRPVKVKGNEFYYKINFITTGIYYPSISSVNISINHYYKQGFMESYKFEQEGDLKWKVLSIDSTIPDETELKFQLRSSETKEGVSLKPFVGPSGTQNTFYTSSPAEIWDGHTYDDWIQYKAFFSTNITSETPILHTIYITYNVLPEVPILKEPGNDTWVKENRPEFTWKFPTYKYDEQRGFQWQMDEDRNFSSINYDSGKINSTEATYTPDFNITEGIWFWRVRIKDNGDDWTAFSEDQTLKVDTTILKPINVTVTPSNWSSIADFTIDWENPLDMSGIKEGAYMYYDDEPPTNANDGYREKSKPIRRTGMKDGIYTFYIWLWDEVENRGFESYSTGEFKLDSRAPSINIGNLEYGNKYDEGQDIKIKAYVDDHLSGVDWVKIYYRNSSEDNYTTAPMNFISDELYTFNIPGEIVHSNRIEFYVEAADKSYPPNKATNSGYGEYDPVTQSYPKFIEIDYPLEVVDFSPMGNNVSVTTKINVTFNHEMRESRIDQHFSVEPYTVGRFSWENNTLIFSPYEPLRYNTIYTVYIDSSTEDMYGNLLENGFQWSFRTTKRVSISSSDESSKGAVSILFVGIIAIIIVIIMILLLRSNILFKSTKPEEPKFKPLRQPEPKPMPVTASHVKHKRKKRAIPEKQEFSPLVTTHFDQSPLNAEFQTRPVECTFCGTYVNESDEKCPRCSKKL